MVGGPDGDHENLRAEGGDEEAVLGVAIAVVIQNGDLDWTDCLRHGRLHIVPKRRAVPMSTRYVASAVEIELAIAHTDHHRAHVLRGIFLGLQIRNSGMD